MNPTLKIFFKYCNILAILIAYNVTMPEVSLYLFAADSPVPQKNEFDIFGDSPGEDSTASLQAATLQTDAPRNQAAGLTIDLVIQKQFSRDSIFTLDKNLAALDSWVVTEFLRFERRPHLAGFLALNLDLGLRNTTNSKTTAINALNSTNGVNNADLLENVHPMAGEELSFLHFYAYQLSLDVALSSADSGNNPGDYYFSAGILPVQMGGSFYRNPVSYFERYLPPRDYIQEYTPLSLPGIRTGFIRDIYSIDILFVPRLFDNAQTSDSDAGKFARYFYFVNPSHVLMVKNSFQFATIPTSVYIFWENFPDSNSINAANHFGFGGESTWLITKELSLNWQFLANNGTPRYYIVAGPENAGGSYSWIQRENSADEFGMTSLFSLNFSGVKNYEFSLGYYYNGFGYSLRDYDSLLAGLDWAKTSYGFSKLAGDPAAVTDAIQFYSTAMNRYDFFSLNRHYLFINAVNVSSPDFFTWGASVFITLEYFSVMPVLFLNVNLDSHTKINIQATATAGVSGSVFGESPLAAAVNMSLEWVF